MQLLVNLHEDELRAYYGNSYERVHRTRGAALSGAHSGHFGIDTAEQQAIVGVNFTPCGAAPFFRDPSNVLGNDHVELEQLWGRDGAVLRERICERRSPAAKLRELEAVLLERAVGALEADAAVQFAISAFDRGAPVSTVVDRVGMSAKRFIRTFAEVVGLTPKRFARVRRFQRVLDVLEKGPTRDWAQLAVAQGYYDQAHLIRDFRQFSGTTPTCYQPRALGDRNHVPLDLTSLRR